jgi:phage terminase large subunit-like protein
MGTGMAEKKPAKKKAAPKRKANPKPESSFDPAIILTLPGYDPYRDAGDCTFHPEIAELAIEFFEQHLTHAYGDLKGKPFLLADYEKAVLANLFGWRTPDGHRRYEEFLLYVPRKNDKTTFCAGIAVMLLQTSAEPGQQIVCMAGEFPQAANLFNTAKIMINQDEWLRSELEPTRMEIRKKGGKGDDTFRILSGKPEGKAGLNPSAAFIDEVYECDEDAINWIITGTAARRNALIGFLTSADVFGETYCNRKLQYAEQVIDGTVKNPRFLPAIFKAEKSDDWHAESTWYKANPNLGGSLPLENFKKFHQLACDDPSFENTFKRLHLNIQTEQAERWIDMEKWAACGNVSNPVDWRTDMLERLKGQECWGGLDVASTSDFTALSLLFHDDGRVVILPWFWLPKDGKWRTSMFFHSYEAWINQGFINLTDGNITDYNVVHNDITKLMTEYGIKILAADTTFQGAHLCRMLMDSGLEVIHIPQSWTHLTTPSKEFNDRIITGVISHGDNPVLTWMANNIQLQYNATGNMFRPAHIEKARELKNDGVIAAIFALSRMIVEPDDSSELDNYRIINGRVCDKDGNPVKVF